MKKQADRRNILMIAASEYDANLYYATRFIAPDPFIFMQLKGKKYLLMNDLEVDRARKQAAVNEVISTSLLAREYKERTGKRPGYVDLVADFLQRKSVREISVPGNFALEYADPLRERGFTLRREPDPFFPERLVKSPAEVRAIEKAIGHVETAFAAAVAVLKKSVIKRGKVYYRGTLVTSESLKKVVNVSLMENDCIAENTIIACGRHAVDPHDRGTGPIYANESIIMDIFPKDSNSRYFADFTRTVVKGKASPKLKKIYAAVHEGQEIGFRMIREGVDASQVHQKIHASFEQQGFKTGLINGRMQGFFHGTGHGLGLDIHELPRVGGAKDILKAGHVVTVEPGLYYEGVGGVRLEDVVVVTKTGCRNLTKAPKFLEIK
jgi:Xaa-Pro aminopeptidase